MIIMNKLVLSILFSPVSITVVASSMLNNIVKIMNIVRSTTLFSHDNCVVTALPLFNHQYCCNLWTRLNNNDNNSEQACSINIVFSCSNNREQPLLLHQCWTTLMLKQWTTLFSHDNSVVTPLLNQQCRNNLGCVGEWNIFRRSSISSDRVLQVMKRKREKLAILPL